MLRRRSDDFEFLPGIIPQSLAAPQGRVPAAPTLRGTRGGNDPSFRFDDIPSLVTLPGVSSHLIESN